MRAKKLAGLFVLVAVMGHLTNTGFGQQPGSREYIGSPVEQKDLQKQVAADKADPHWWYINDPNTDSAEAVIPGTAFRKPNNYVERISDTRAVFKRVENSLTTKEQKQYLEACRAMREAGIVRTAGYSFRDPLFLRAAFTGPFISREGRRDHQVMAEFLRVMAEDAYIKAGKAYLEVRNKTPDKVVAEVAMALEREHGQAYAADMWQRAISAGVFRRWDPVFSGYLYEYQSRELQLKPGIPFQEVAEVDQWRKVLEYVASLDSNGPKKPAPAGGRFRLGMNPGASLPWRGANDQNPSNLTMPSVDELRFIARQAQMCWDLAMNPPSEFFASKPIATYWVRDAEPNELPLLVKAVQNPLAMYASWGSEGSPVLRFNPSVSLLRGLCFWKQEQDDFERGLSREGVAQEVIDHWFGRVSLSTAKWSNLNDAEKKWWDGMIEGANRFDSLNFARERRKWCRLATIEEYEKLNAQLQEWVKAHPDAVAFRAKVNLCLAFEARIPEFDGYTGGPKFTLDSLEALAAAQAAKVVANAP